MDLEIIELRNKIIEDLNGANVPITVKKYVLAEVLNAVSQATENEIAKQLKAREDTKNDVQQD